MSTNSIPPTKQRILDAALVQFAENGFAGTSIRSLAEAVEVQKSSIYSHFTSKEEIYQSLIDQWGAGAFIERLKSPEYGALANDPIAFCQQCSRDLIDRWMDKRERLFIAVISTQRNELSEGAMRFHDMVYNQENEILATYFRGFREAGLIKTSDVRECARIFSSGFICLRMAYVNAPNGPAPLSVLEQAMARYLDCFYEMIGITKNESS